MAQIRNGTNYPTKHNPVCICRVWLQTLTTIQPHSSEQIPFDPHVRYVHCVNAHPIQSILPNPPIHISRHCNAHCRTKCQPLQFVAFVRNWCIQLRYRAVCVPRQHTTACTLVNGTHYLQQTCLGDPPRHAQVSFIDAIYGHGLYFSIHLVCNQTSQYLIVGCMVYTVQPVKTRDTPRVCIGCTSRRVNNPRKSANCTTVDTQSATIQCIMCFLRGYIFLTIHSGSSWIVANKNVGSRMWCL